jgi:hypothetical protein
VRLIGCVLLLSGFAIVLAALVLLTALMQRFAFVGAGFAIELLGLGLLTYGYQSLQKARG